MTATAETVPAQQAREIRPGRWLATAFAAVFVTLGWLAGAIVTSVIFTGSSIRYGWHRGRGRSDEMIAARASARAVKAAPEPPPAPRPSKM
jgi:hypothetical protein